MPFDAEELSIPSKLKPLVVDLDGTLVRSDLLAKSAFAHLGRDPLAVVGLLSALLRGKAALKAEIAAKTVLDVTQLPYDDVVVSIIRKARAAGNPVYLASASNERYVRAVADHLGLFDGCFASTDDENLSSAFKARRLVEVFGKAGFDYIGNERADLAVWAVADRRTAVRASPAVKTKLRDMDPDAIVLEDAAYRNPPLAQIAKGTSMGEELAGLRALRNRPTLRSPLIRQSVRRVRRFLAGGLCHLHYQ